jgi:selenocysteine-specific elongation factor
MAILDLLSVRRGLVVLSKVDLVDPEWLGLVAEEVRERLRGTSLADAPLVPVSARTGQGLDELLRALDAQLDRTPSRAEAAGAPRLPIDRAFTIGGFGTVVTGTLSDGPLLVGEEVELLPRGLRARVRGLQSHNSRLERALPGTRVAVNLAGVSHHELARGDVLARPGLLRPTELIDVQVRLVAGLEHPLVQNAALDLFVGAAEVPCRATLLDRDELGPGESGWLQLRLTRPVAAARGERYILRLPSPSQTVGGGVVVDPHPPRHRRFRADVIAGLEALARGTPADLLRRPLADGQPHAWADLRRAAGLGEQAAREGLAELLAAGEVLLLDRAQDGAAPGAGTVAPGQHLVTAAGYALLSEKLLAAARGYHRRYPLRPGIPREELRSRLKLGAAAFDALLAAVAEQGAALALEAHVRLPEHRPVLEPAQQRAVERLLRACAETPYSPPAPELDPELLVWLFDQGRLVRVSDDVAFLPETYAALVDWVRAQIAEAGSVSVAQFRDRFATSRKYALALLEHLDERKITRRQGDVRVLY